MDLAVPASDALPERSATMGRALLALMPAMALLAVTMSATCHAAGEAGAGSSQPWAMPMGNPQRTGLSELSAADCWGTMAWSADLSTGRSGDVLVRSDGSVMVWSGGLIKRYLADGTPGWTALVEETGVSRLAMAGDGTMYAIGWTGLNWTLHALSPEGEQVWSFGGMKGPVSEPVVAPDGTVYITAMDGARCLYAVAANGTLLWRTGGLGNSYSSGVALGRDGMVYVATDRLQAVRPNGTLAWEVELLYGATSPPMVGPDGTVYVILGSGGLYAVTEGGGRRLVCPAPTETGSTLALGPDGAIIMEAVGGSLQAVKPDGTVLWTLDVEGGVSSPAAVSAEGTVYVGAGGDSLIAVASDGEPIWRFLPQTDDEHFGGPWGPAIGPGGTVYVVFGWSMSVQPDYRTLYALATRCVTGDTGDLDMGQPPLSVWPLQGGDAGHTGRGPAGSNATEGSLMWSYEGASRYWSAPVIGPDGTLYLGSESGDVTAIDPSGRRLWEFETGYAIYDSPALGANGTVLVTNDSGHLIAIGTDGRLRWDLPLWESLSAPAVGPGGIVYVGERSGALCAVNPWGTVRWALTTGQGPVGTPAVGPDGKVYFTTEGSMLYCVAPAGTIVWARPLPMGEQRWSRSTPSWPCVGPDGSVLVTVDGTVSAFDRDGVATWSYADSAKGFTEPTVGRDGTVYVGAYGGELIALAPGGTVLWRFTVTEDIEAPPATAADGRVLFCAHNVTYAMDPDGSLAWRLPLWSDRHSMFIYDNCPAGVVVGLNGTVYATFFGSGIQAIGHVEAGADGGPGGGAGGPNEHLFRVGFWASLAMALLMFMAFIGSNAHGISAAWKASRAKDAAMRPPAPYAQWPTAPPPGAYWDPRQWPGYPPGYPYAQYPPGPQYAPYPQFPQQPPPQAGAPPPRVRPPSGTA